MVKALRLFSVYVTGVSTAVNVWLLHHQNRMKAGGEAEDGI